MMTKKFAIFNRKGGVGKTTTATSLAAIFARRGYRTLLVDADSQGNASQLMGMGDAAHGLDLVLTGADVAPTPSVYRELDVLPAGKALAQLELQITLGLQTCELWALRDWIPADTYDCIILDCPPNYSTSCLASLMAADEVIIPVGMDAYSQHAAPDIVEQLDTLKAVAPSVKVGGLLLTRYHRGPLASATKALINDGTVHLYGTVIPQSDKVGESTFDGSPVGIYSPRSGPAKAYELLADELLEEAQSNG